MKARPRSPRHPRAAPQFFSRQVSEVRRFHLNLKPPKNRPLAVVCGGLEHTARGYAIDRPTFPYYAIEYVARGRGTVRLRNRTHALEPGSLFSYGPGIRQDMTSDPAKPLVKYFVDFTGRQALPLLVSCRLPPGSVAHVLPPAELEGVFDELIRSGLRHSGYAPEICATLLQWLALKIRESSAPLGDAGTLSFGTYQQCRQFIQEHFLRLRSLDQAAQECHVDGAYMCRLFKRYDHVTPYRFLSRLKLNFAADALRQPGALVKQVSEKAGFTDPFHFSRVFKACFGVSPEAFRRLR